jgi:hypothetical protein
MSGCRSRFLIAVVGVLLAGGPAPIAHADAPSAPSASSVKEAGKHFQRGVTLYNEADYRAALVEFRRAFEIAPNAAVLYNIGQTYYQLQNYAAALSTLARYLSESGATAAHRPEVEQTIETLQARVGKVAVSTNVADCEITIDDELVGRTPLTDPLLVSIGRRKVTAMRPGRAPETRFVDVAAGDTVQLTMSLGEPSVVTPVITPPKPAAAATSGGNGLITAGWVTTGVLGAGAITAGVLAFLASRDLKDARDTFPGSHDDLTTKSSRLSRYSTIADIAGLAAVVAGGLTLTFSLTRSESHEVHVAVAPNGVQLAGTFK